MDTVIAVVLQTVTQGMKVKISPKIFSPVGVSVRGCSQAQGPLSQHRRGSHRERPDPGWPRPASLEQPLWGSQFFHKSHRRGGGHKKKAPVVWCSVAAKCAVGSSSDSQQELCCGSSGRQRSSRAAPMLCDGGGGRVLSWHHQDGKVCSEVAGLAFLCSVPVVPCAVHRAVAGNCCLKNSSRPMRNTPVGLQLLRRRGASKTLRFLGAQQELGVHGPTVLLGVVWAVLQGQGVSAIHGCFVSAPPCSLL